MNKQKAQFIIGLHATLILNSKEKGFGWDEAISNYKHDNPKWAEEVQDYFDKGTNELYNKASNFLKK